MRNSRRPRVLGLGLGLLFLFTGCEIVGELEEQTFRLPPRGEEALQVTLDLGAGELDLKGGEPEILSAHFAYNVASWAPHVNYQVRGNTGILRIGHEEDDHGIPLGEFENRWNLVVNNRLPMDLKVNVGVGSSSLALQELNLSRLNVEMGVGELRVNLARVWQHDLKVAIEIGIGEVRIDLPKSIGVRVHVDRGIGEVSAPGFSRQGDAYVNTVLGAAEHMLDLHVDLGIGEVRIAEGDEILEVPRVAGMPERYTLLVASRAP